MNKINKDNNTIKTDVKEIETVFSKDKYVDRTTLTYLTKKNINKYSWLMRAS